MNGKERRYYLIRITAGRRALTAALRTDWGTLDVGTHVVDAEYAFLVYKPNYPARWYTMGLPARYVTVPTHLLLRVGFPMQRCMLTAKSNQRQRAACDRNAVELSNEEHVAAIATLQRRGGA